VIGLSERVAGDTFWANRRRLFFAIEALRLILREYDLHRGEMQFTAENPACAFIEQP
jgi:hypothetical protein